MKKLSLISVCAAAIMFSFSGCAQKSGDVAMSECKTLQECANLAIERKSELESKEVALKQKEEQIHKLEMDLQKAQAAKSSVKCPPCPTPKCDLFPPNAKPGECYARVLTPPKYKIVTEKVLVKEAGEKLVTIPAKYEWVTEKVMVKEPGEKIITIPPVYKTVTERVMVKGPSKKVITIPAKYKTVTEKILVSPEHTEWKRGRGPVERMDSITGEIMCLVKVPAKYKTITKRVMVSPPQVKEVEVPPVYKTITKRVLVKPAETKKITIPAVYKTVRVKKMVTPPQVKKIEIPPVYKTVTKRIKVEDSKLVWKPILCKTNMNADTIRRLQIVLKKAGYYHGPIDGIYGPLTKAAVRKFQKDKGLPTGALTLETLRACRVAF
ncbi:MAG: peptidoglycan-binding protein [Epsilonproteobacteria bacterium]|nr:peptidoglycan-binding protein [Campylobacterota bacterium]